MQGLLTKEDVRQFLGLKTLEATEKLLRRLDVPRVDFSLIGGKGIRYRRTDIEEALAKIEIKPQSTRRPHKKKKLQSDLFDLPIKEQMAILTAGGLRQ